MKYHVDHTRAGRQWSFKTEPRPKRQPGTFRMETIFQTPIRDRYPEHLRPSDFVEPDRVQVVRIKTWPGKADWD